MIERLGREAIEPRGPMSRQVLRLLAEPAPTPGLAPDPRTVSVTEENLKEHDDAQLTLWLLYELHYRGIGGVDERWEWDPTVLRLAYVLETALEQELRTAVSRICAAASDLSDVAAALLHIASADDGPQLSSQLARNATANQSASSSSTARCTT